MRITLAEAASHLKHGDVVAVPTETVYGLAASLNEPSAIQKIYSLKNRPANNPLIIHVASASMVSEYAQVLPPGFTELAQEFWPGPLTLVLPAISNKIPYIATAGLSTAAFRVPEHSLTLKLLELTGPLVMPSANLSGKPSATTAEHVENDFGVDFPVVDGGPCSCGLESTILFWNGSTWVVARLGAIEPDAFAKGLGYMPEVSIKGSQVPICPGQMYRHYAPKASLGLVHTIPDDGGEAVVGFSDRRYSSKRKLYSLGSSQEPLEAAQRLYSVLRQLDLDGVGAAIVDIDFPENGLWLTLKERLEKAAHSCSSDS